MDKQKRQSAIVGIILLVLIVIGDVVAGISGIASPYSINFSTKSTGGCAFGCNQQGTSGNTYCSGLTTKPITTRSANPRLLVFVSIGTMDLNTTGATAEIQIDLTTDLSNNVYGAQSFCGTFVQEFGVVQYYPITTAFFTTSAIASFPLTGNTLGSGTYFASVSFRPSSSNLLWRISTPATNYIGIQEEV